MPYIKLILPEEAIELLWKILTQSILNRYKSNTTFLKGEGKGKENFSCAIFSTSYEDRLYKGVLNILLLQCLSSLIYNLIY